MQDLLAAADRSRAEGAAKRAVELYTDALRLVAGDEFSRRAIRLLRGLASVEMEDFEGGAAELGELLPDLDGRGLLEALLGLARASLWMERTDEGLDFAERSLELSEGSGDREMRGPALAVLSQIHGQRGREGDLRVAVELGDRALEAWVPGTRANDLAAHESLHALTHYWAGGYERAVELGRRGGDGATEGLALVALGRHEEALEVFDSAIASQRELDSTIGTAYRSTARPRRCATCSTSPRRGEGTRRRASSTGGSGSRAA